MARRNRGLAATDCAGDSNSRSAVPMRKHKGTVVDRLGDAVKELPLHDQLTAARAFVELLEGVVEDHDRDLRDDLIAGRA